MRRLEPVLRRALRGPCALEPGARVLVAVSGGADSTALLLGLCRISHELRLHLQAAHLHHGLRGEAADGDLRFVRSLCAHLGVPLTWARWNTRLRMRRRGLAGQAGLRTLRREFLMTTSRRMKATAIATAHTADDQLETVLLRLMRGTGMPGLGAMSHRRGRWIKPLLEATRADLEADLREGNQAWREDGSNRDLAYARSRVRHIVVPALVDSLGPGHDPARARSLVARRVARVAREARETRRAIEHWSATALSRCARFRDEEIDLDSSRLGSYPQVLRRAVLLQAWRRLAPGGNGLTYNHLTTLSRLILHPRGGATVELPAGFRAERDGDFVRLGRHRSGSQPEALRLPVPGRVSLGRFMIKADWTLGDRARRHLPLKFAGEEYFASSGLEGGLEVRTARADERFVPFGRRHSVAVGEFLRRQGVSRELRSRPTVLADAGGILWMIGVRRSARAPLSADTRRALRVHAENHD